MGDLLDSYRPLVRIEITQAMIRIEKVLNEGKFFQSVQQHFLAPDCCRRHILLISRISHFSFKSWPKRQNLRPEFKSKWSIYPPKPMYQPKKLEKGVFLPPSRVFWQCLNINQWTTSHIYLYTTTVEVGVTTSKTNTQTQTQTHHIPHKHRTLCHRMRSMMTFMKPSLRCMTSWEQKR